MTGGSRRFVVRPALLNRVVLKARNIHYFSGLLLDRRLFSPIFEGMKFWITRTSSWNGQQPIDRATKEGDYWYIEINTLEELMSIVEEDHIVIQRPEKRSTRYPQNTLPYIEIYDTYRE